jgi:hypothetical protein
MSNFAFVENNQIVTIQAFLPDNWRNVSGFDKLDNDSIKSFGWYPINKENLIYDEETHEIESTEYKIENNDVYAYYKLKLKEILSEEEKQNILQSQALGFLQRKWNEVREERDQKMKEFDWRYIRYEREQRLGLPTTDNISVLDDYAQQLADVTNQPDPMHISWPTYNGSEK